MRKFEKTLAAATLAAAECTGVGCTPRMPALSLPARMEVMASNEGLDTRRLREREDREVSDAIKRIATSDLPDKEFAALSSRTQSLILERSFEAMQKEQMPELFIKLQPNLEKIRTDTVAALVKEGRLLIKNGEIIGMNGPKGPVIFDQPLEPQDAITAASNYHYAKIDWVAPPEVASPYLLIGRDDKGGEIAYLNFPNFFTGQVQVSKHLKNGGIVDTVGHIIQPIPHGIKCQDKKTASIVNQAGVTIIKEEHEQTVKYKALGFHFTIYKLGGNSVTRLDVLDTNLSLAVDDDKPISSANENAVEFFNPNGTITAERHKSGGLSLYNANSELGTFAEIRAKRPDYRHDQYAADLAKNLNSPRQWLAYVKAYHEDNKSNDEDPFKSSKKSFCFFTQEILRQQGVKSAVVEVKNIGLGTAWIVKGKGDSFDAYGISPKLYSYPGPVFIKNLKTQIDDYRNIRPFRDLDEAASAVANKYFPNESPSKIRFALDMWQKFDGDIPVLMRTPEGKVKEAEVALEEIENPGFDDAGRKIHYTFE